MNAYITGLERRIKAGHPIDHVASVASFFISRIDSNIDSRLSDIGGAQAADLQGKIAVANAKLAYAVHNLLFSGMRWDELKKENGRVQTRFVGFNKHKKSELIQIRNT